MRIIPLAIRRVAAVGDVDKVLMRQFGKQRFQYAQAAYAGVEDAYRLGHGWVMTQSWAGDELPSGTPLVKVLPELFGQVQHKVDV